MKPEDFEKRLEHQPMRQIPAEWRVEILDAARRAQNYQFLPSSLERTSWWRELLWPCPQAWAGLAALWVVILIITFSTRNEPSQTVAKQAKQTAPQYRELIFALKEHQRELNELIGIVPPGVAGGSKPYSPRPRSERRNEIMAA